MDTAKEAASMAKAMNADHRSCVGPCDHGRCWRCGYLPHRDKATAIRHADACRYAGRDLAYTASPACPDRAWHHYQAWCDTCEGVA